MKPLSDSDWEVLLGLAEELIPAEGEMPAGGAVLAGGDLASVTEELPDLLPQVRSAVGKVGDLPAEERLAALTEDDPEGLAAIGELAAAVYFLEPEVARLIGYRRREAVPIVFDSDLVELTRPVVSLGFRSPVPE